MVSDVSSYEANDAHILSGDARLLRATREPCPICGHPTGDCVGESVENLNVVGAEAFPSLQHENVHIVEEDVYEERAISPFTRAKVLVAAKGTAMPVSRAKELGLL